MPVKPPSPLVSETLRSTAAIIPAAMLAYWSRRYAHGLFAAAVPGLICWGVFALVHALLTLVAFVGLRGERLAMALSDAPRGPGWWQRVRKTPLFRFLFARAEGPMWSAYVSVTALVTAIILGIGQRRVGDPIFMIAGSTVVIGSWANLLMTHTLHYARLDHRTPSLAFPGDGERTFWDYLYLGTSAHVTFGTTDVEVTTSHMRRTITIHALLAFVFNTVILAILISALIG